MGHRLWRRRELLEELDESRKFGQQQAAAARASEKARATAQRRIERLEKDLRAVNNKLREGIAAVSAKAGRGRDQVTEPVDEDGPIPGQSAIVDEKGLPVVEGDDQ